MANKEVAHQRTSVVAIRKINRFQLEYHAVSDFGWLRFRAVLQGDLNRKREWKRLSVASTLQWSWPISIIWMNIGFATKFSRIHSFIPHTVSQMNGKWWSRTGHIVNGRKSTHIIDEKAYYAWALSKSIESVKNHTSEKIYFIIIILLCVRYGIALQRCRENGERAVFVRSLESGFSFDEREKKGKSSSFFLLDSMSTWNILFSFSFYSYPMAHSSLRKRLRIPCAVPSHLRNVENDFKTLSTMNA